MLNGNPLILRRLDELIAEGERVFEESTKARGGPVDSVSLARWITSSLNLLDKLSVSTNRFVKQFEAWIRPRPHIEAALGVLKSAKDEYSLGLAVEYQLSVSAAVFEGLLDQADYLLKHGYERAAAVLAGAALEEGLKNRARAAGLEVSSKDTLNPIIIKLKAIEVGVLTEFEAKRLEAVAKMRNDAAHGGEFTYRSEQISEALSEIRTTLEKVLSAH
jgi:hypothetical protein